MASFDVASSSDTVLEGMLDSIASEAKDQKAFTFDGNTFQFEKSMLVGNTSYGNVEDKVNNIDVDAVNTSARHITLHSYDRRA